jgi:hypothetical protein
MKACERVREEDDEEGTRGSVFANQGGGLITLTLQVLISDGDGDGDGGLSGTLDALL